MTKSFIGVNILLALGYTGSALLVLVYVNMFPVWKFLSTRWASEFFILMPVMVSLGTIAAITGSFYLLQQNKGFSIDRLPLITGLLLCLLGLIIPDPEFPVKRIHVAEYVLLSLVVRWTMSFRLQGGALLYFSACFVALLGVHDELLQGLLPSRTYGLRDVTVNSLAGFGGAYIWHAVHLFTREISLPRKNDTGVRLSIVYVGWLLTTVLAYILPLVLYRGGHIPYWPAMPLIGTLLLFSLYTDQFTESWKHGVGALSAVSFALILYPLITYGKAFSFY
jgi:hypothetical protein